MYQKFGAIVTNHHVEFQLFLPDNKIDPGQYTRGGDPNIKEIRIRGDFQHEIGGQDWELASAPVMVKQPHPQGWLYTYSLDPELPDGFYEYKYFVTFENDTRRWVTDPCTKYGGSSDHENAAFVIGGQHATVQPLAGRLPPKDLIIYELMIDDFTAEFRGNRAPLDAIRDKLDYLQELGVNAIEFMPWTAWPGGNFSWGYDPFQFFSVEYRYLNDDSAPADKLVKLKTLINELHRRRIHVIMDGVFNHVRAGTSPDRGFAYLWLYQEPEDSPYIGQFERAGFFEEFDYDNRCTQEFIRDVCLYWLEDYQIDGIRFDYTLGFHRHDDQNTGIAKLIAEVKDYLAASNKMNVALILEHLTDNRYEAINHTNQICASGCWFDPFMFKSFQYSRSGHIDLEVLRILNANLDYAADKGPVTYIQNHDHSSIICEAGGRHRWFKSQPAAIALLTTPGTVMLHNGQELGQDYCLPDSGPDRVIPRRLRWQEHSQDFVGERLSALYKKLIQIRKNHPALRTSNVFPANNHPDGYGAFPDKDVVIFHRYGPGQDGHFERFIIIINYSDFDQYVDIPFSTNGEWQDLLNETSDFVDHFRLFNQRISSNWGRVYYQ